MSKKLFLLFSFFVNMVHADKYWISFKDKSGVTFDPYQYFDERAIYQRIKWSIPINDSSDYPVSENYLSAISLYCDSITFASRWLNGASVFCNRENALIISSFQFVKAIEPMEGRAILAEEKTIDARSFKGEKDKILSYQTERMSGSYFKSNNIDGSGIRIAVFDAGFPGVNTHPAFRHLFNKKKIIATYDFIAKNENVYVSNKHGTSTLSCIAGMKDSIKIGLATDAEFLLARTEYSIREKFSEEEKWIAAAEWADKQGVNIISSSLGYTYNRYFNTEMNGKTSLIARGATIAAQKGILVISAAGNEGADRWHFIDTPADADSVLAVGGIDPYTDMHINFSSYGPTSDGRLKPNVCATAHAFVADAKGYKVLDGTSFSTPLVAGFAACAWQLKKELTNMQLFRELEKSGNLFPYCDYAHGYGVPIATRLFKNNTTEPTFDFVIVNTDIKVILREKYSYTEQEKSLGYAVRRNLYYKIENSFGKIKEYNVLLAENKEVLSFSAEDFNVGDVITIHFEGFTNTLDFPGQQENK